MDEEQLDTFCEHLNLQIPATPKLKQIFNLWQTKVMNKSSKLSTVENTKRRLREKFLPKSPPGKASKYIHHLDEYLKQHPDIEALIYGRDSTCAQNYKRNLKTQKKVLRRELGQRAIPIVSHYYNEVSSGWVLDKKRWALVDAVEEAKKLIKKGIQAVIVAPSTDRFLRNRDFHTKERPDLLPTEAEFEKLKELTCNIPLATLLHPDMPPREVRSYQTKWGQEAKGNKGGRPEKKGPGYKKRRRIRKRGRVIWLYKQGTAVCDIARKTNVKQSTINDWIVKYGG
ncbi:MAG: helix-turn-helix domain-containing protein [Sedimentisphaerales bacterium]